MLAENLPTTLQRMQDFNKGGERILLLKKNRPEFKGLSKIAERIPGSRSATEFCLKEVLNSERKKFRETLSDFLSNEYRVLEKFSKSSFSAGDKFPLSKELARERCTSKSTSLTIKNISIAQTVRDLYSKRLSSRLAQILDISGISDISGIISNISGISDISKIISNISGIISNISGISGIIDEFLSAEVYRAKKRALTFKEVGPLLVSLQIVYVLACRQVCSVLWQAAVASCLMTVLSFSKAKSSEDRKAKFVKELKAKLAEALKSKGEDKAKGDHNLKVVTSSFPRAVEVNRPSQSAAGAALEKVPREESFSAKQISLHADIFPASLFDPGNFLDLGLQINNYCKSKGVSLDPREGQNFFYRIFERFCAGDCAIGKLILPKFSNGELTYFVAHILPCIPNRSLKIGQIIFADEPSFPLNERNRIMLALLPKVKSLSRLALIGYEPISSFLALCGHLTSLQELDLSHTDLDIRQVGKILRTFSELAILRVNGCLGLSQWGSLLGEKGVIYKNLIKLSADGTPLEEKDLQGVFTMFPNLRSLNLSRCFNLESMGLTEEKEEDELRACKIRKANLLIAKATNNKTSAEKNALSQEIEELRDKIKDLEASIATRQKTDKIPLARHLECLDLSQVNLSAKAVEKIFRICPGLEKLILESISNISPFLTNLSLLPKLVKLRLRSTNFDNQGFKLLAQQSPNLTYLDISSCKITALSEFLGLNYLEELNLSANAFKEQDLAVLPVSTKGLRVLYLENCLDDLISLDYLFPLSRLCYLKVPQELTPLKSRLYYLIKNGNEVDNNIIDLKQQIRYLQSKRIWQFADVKKKQFITLFKDRQVLSLKVHNPTRWKELTAKMFRENAADDFADLVRIFPKQHQLETLVFQRDQQKGQKSA